MGEHRAAAAEDASRASARAPRESLRARPRVIAGVLVAGAALTIGAPAALAAEIAVDQPCYSRGDEVSVTMTGMPAGELIDVTMNDDVVAEVRIDAGGVGSAKAPAPKGSPPLPVRVRAQISLDVLAETSMRLDVPFVKMLPSRAKPTSRVTYTLSGFARSGPVYAHVVRGRKRVRRVRVGTPRTRCGVLTARIAQLPLKNAPKGTYYVQFDQYKAYRAKRSGSVRRKVRVRFAPKTKKPRRGKSRAAQIAH